MKIHLAIALHNEINGTPGCYNRKPGIKSGNENAKARQLGRAVKILGIGLAVLAAGLGRRFGNPAGDEINLADDAFRAFGIASVVYGAQVLACDLYWQARERAAGAAGHDQRGMSAIQMKGGFEKFLGGGSFAHEAQGLSQPHIINHVLRAGLHGVMNEKSAFFDHRPFAPPGPKGRQR